MHSLSPYESKDFIELPLAERQSVHTWMSIVEAADGSPNKSVAFRALGEQYGHLPGFSEVNIRTKYYAWVKAGRSWTALVNRAKAPEFSGVEKRTAGNKKALIAVYKGYAENNQRSSLQAWNQLMRDLFCGVRLKGIGTWQDLYQAEFKRPAPDRPPAGWVPRGMSYRTLQNIAGLSKFEAAASRVGMAAASQFLPHVFSTRVGLLPGQIFEFDDVFHDLVCNFLGVNRKALRPLEFACIDVASGCKVAKGMKPEILRDDGTRERLNEREMRFLVAHVLANVGFRRDGCTMIIEHGTATIRPEVREVIGRITNKSVHFETSGFLGESVHKGLFPGRSKGNFRMKAALESSHRLIHSMTAMLPGQVGANSRDDKPEQLEAMSRYNEIVLRAARSLPEKEAARLAYPVISFDDYADFYERVVTLINQRTEHDLEGFEQNRWTVTEWRMGEGYPWASADMIDSMEPANAAACRAVASQPGNSRTRLMAPCEVWDAYQSELVRVSPYHLSEVLGESCMRLEAPDEHGVIEFEHRYYGPGKHRYLGHVIAPDGSARELQRGRKYQIYLSPYDQVKALVVDPSNGVVVGLAPRWAEACKTDPKTLHMLMGIQNHLRANAQAVIIDRHAPEIEGRKLLLENNAPLIQEAERIEKAEKKLDRKEKKAVSAAAEDSDDALLELAGLK